MQVFNARIEYALRAVSELAARASEGPVQSREIAVRQAIPEAYLDQLLSALRRAGMVRSIRGPSGGYMLNRSPHQISVWDVVRACNGEECFSAPSPTEETGEVSTTMACVVRDVRERVERAVSEILMGITVRDLLDQRRRLDETQAAMFHI